MANEKRTAGKQIRLDSGPYIGRVLGHLDPNYMGSLEVELLKVNSSSGDQFEGQTFKVKYGGPFMGQTPAAGVTKNEGFDFTQQAYGMWFTPPDVGSRVIVVFIEGQANMGMWIGCVQDNFINFSMPDRVAGSMIAGSAKGEGAKEAVKNTKKAVLGEINKKNLADNKGNDPTKFKKPINEEWMDVLYRKGIASDGTRGLSTASARREVPSMVFGISTPGAYDKRGGKPKVKYGAGSVSIDVPMNRLGGTQFVIDDGDDKILRKGPASTTKKEYASVGAGEKGDVTLPHNELTRLRTRTGHQILMHNTEDLVRIEHGSGNSWIEMSANGKIDVYSKDSISMHTENDLNITADRDINMHSGRDFNVLSESDIHHETLFNMTARVGKNFQQTTLGDVDILTEGHNWITAGATTEINSGGDHIETAPNIHMNGPTAQKAIPILPLTTHVVPGATATATSSLHKRLPQHEPWGNHENVDPTEYTPLKLDRLDDKIVVKNLPDVDAVPDTFKKEGA